VIGMYIEKYYYKTGNYGNKEAENKTRYDFQYTDKYGYKKTIEYLSHMFLPEFWNYAKLISGVLRHEMPIVNVVDLVGSLRLDS